MIFFVTNLQGEVVNVATNAANNPLGVGFLGGNISDPPTQTKVVEISEKVNELLGALVHA